jgi:hypothetical protein
MGRLKEKWGEDCSPSLRSGLADFHGAVRKQKMTFSLHSKVLFYCPFANNSKLLTLQVNKKTTTGKPAVVIFLLSG